MMLQCLRWVGCRTAAVLALLPMAAQTLRDPYCVDDAALARAGYVSHGPFAFGNLHDSDQVQALLPDEPLVWLETAHFRIGASLSPCRLEGDKQWLLQVQEELRRLALRLPLVSADVRQLDPLLRAHLVAQRAEDVYADVQAVLGVDDNSFPRAPGDDPRRPGTFMGLGPYLGMPHKYTILLLRQSQSLARYTAAYHGWATTQPVRHHDHAFGTAFFGAAEQSNCGLYGSDVALRTHLTFHLAYLCYTSYRAYGHDLPAWIPVGLAWWHARKISTLVPIYDLEPDAAGHRRYAQWQKRLPVLLRKDGLPPLPALLQRMDVDSFTMDEHFAAWAMIDQLLRCQRPQFVRFLNRMKDPFHDRLRFPTLEELQARQREALQLAFGVDAQGLAAVCRRQSPPGRRRRVRGCGPRGRRWR